VEKGPLAPIPPPTEGKTIGFPCGRGGAEGVEEMGGGAQLSVGDLKEIRHHTNFPQSGTVHPRLQVGMVLVDVFSTQDLGEPTFPSTLVAALGDNEVYIDAFSVEAPGERSEVVLVGEDKRFHSYFLMAGKRP
jgi:hypothetical protein